MMPTYRVAAGWHDEGPWPRETWSLPA